MKEGVGKVCISEVFVNAQEITLDKSTWRKNRKKRKEN